MGMKFYIIAGEASGDLHASNLIKEIKLRSPESEFRCWGGDRMRDQGAVIVKHYRDLAFMGFWDVLFNIRTIFNNIGFCKSDIAEYKPDVLILVDYPGFNLRIAKYANSLGLKVFYYISPQVWAWKSSRVKLIKKVVDKMFVILPFEKDFYKKYNYDVDFIGHPLIDAIEANAQGVQLSFDKPVVALLPGSRQQEIKRILPVMSRVSKHYSNYQFVVAGTSTVPKEVYKSHISGKDISIVYDRTYDLLKTAKAALVTSGTATLETALHLVPEVVCYKGDYLSSLIARQLIKTRFIAMVNLVMDKEVVKELIQSEFNEHQLKIELDKLLLDNAYRSEMMNNYKELKYRLGGSGASASAAELMLKYLS